MEYYNIFKTVPFLAYLAYRLPYRYLTKQAPEDQKWIKFSDECDDLEKKISETEKTEAKIHRYYSDGSTGHTLDSNDGAGYNDIDNTKYDNGSGTLQTMQNSKFSVQRLFYFPTTPDIIVAYYGKAFYNSIDDAERSYNLEDFTEAEKVAEVNKNYFQKAVDNGFGENFISELINKK